MSESANTRINHLWERVAIGLLALILGWGQIQYQEDKQDLKELEAKVQTLYLEKVSKDDLKQVEDRINSNITAMKSDIIARMDLYFGRLEVKK